MIIGGVLAATFGTYIVRRVPLHALMAVFGVLVSSLALFQLANQSAGTNWPTHYVSLNRAPDSRGWLVDILKTWQFD